MVDMNTGYITTIHGILKIVEMVLSMIVFICAIVPYIYTGSGMGFVQFVGISAFILLVILIIFHLARIIERFAFWALLELILYVIYSLFFLIAFIISAVVASKWGGCLGSNSGWCSHYGGIIAAALFSGIAFIVFVIDTLLQFKNWRFTVTSSGGTTTHSSHTSTTVTTTTVAA